MAQATDLVRRQLCEFVRTETSLSTSDVARHHLGALQDRQPSSSVTG